VILELGYFMGRDQQSTRKLIILKRNPVEGPSDIHGVETFNYSKSIDEISMKLQKQLKHWKVIAR
jgi:predicted nucleotide-binding protein